MILLSLFSLSFKLPKHGNNEMMQAVNAAIEQLQRFGVIDSLYSKYFGLVRREDHDVFASYLGDIQKRDVDYMILPSFSKQFMDCDFNNVQFPNAVNLTVGGSLYNMLTSKMMYVLQEIDIPGFWSNKFQQQVYQFDQYPGFEQELLTAVADQISAYYLKNNEKIQVKVSNKVQKKKIRVNGRSQYQQIQEQNILHNFKQQRSFHVGSGGYPNTNLKAYGAFSCGTILQEVGIMGNFGALQSFFRQNGRDQENLEPFVSAFKAAKSFNDLLEVSRSYLQPASNIPLCTKSGSLGHIVAKQFDNCGDKCKNPNFYSDVFTDVKFNNGAFDKFVKGECLLFVSESAQMISLYKTLSDGVQAKIFPLEKLKTNDSIKFNYMFGADLLDTAQRYRYSDVLAQNFPFMSKTFVSAFVLPSDSSDHKHGNTDVANLLSYAIELWSSQISDLFQTKYAETIKQNFQVDKQFVTNVSIKPETKSTWMDKDPNILNRETFFLVTKLAQAIYAIDPKTLADVSILVDRMKVDFPQLNNYMKNIVKDSINCNETVSENFTRNFLLYNLMVDYLSNTTVIASSTEKDILLALFKHQNSQIFKYIAKPFKQFTYYTQKGSKKFVATQAAIVPGTFVVSSFQLGENSAFVAKYNDANAEKTQTTSIDYINELIVQKQWPEFMFVANQFVEQMNIIEGLSTYDEVVDKVFTFGFSTFLDELDEKNYSNNFIIKNQKNDLQLYGVFNVSVNIPGSFFTFPAYNVVKGNITLDLSTTKCTTDCSSYFYRLSTMYPYTQNTVSRLYLLDQVMSVENLPCQLTIKSLSDLPIEFHKYFVSKSVYDNTTEVRLCLQYPSLPVALTQYTPDKPIIEQEQVIGTYDLVKSTRNVFISTFNKIPGFRISQRTGFDDVILKYASFAVKEAFGQSLTFQSLTDLQQQDKRLSQLISEDPQVQLLMSAEFADDTTINYARNYLISNMTFISHSSRKCSRYIQNMELVDYLKHDCAKDDQNEYAQKKLNFCLGPGTSSFFTFFQKNYKQDIEFSSVLQATNVNQLFNGLLSGKCDISLAYDVQVLPALRTQPEGFVFKQYAIFQKHIAPMLRKDAVDVQVQPLIQQDTTLISLTIVICVILALVLLVGMMLIISFRSWLRFINRIV